MSIAIVITGFLFVLGTAVGSFLTVVIYRTIHDESWVSGRSHCDHCRRKIKWYDNIPILSYLLLQGKARCCGRTIPISYPVIEFMTGVLFVWWYQMGSFFFKLTTSPLQTLQPLFWLIVGVLLVLIFFADLLYFIIPDVAVGIMLLLTVIYRVYLTVSGIMQLQDLLLAVMGTVLSLALIGGLWLITKGKGMGLGDVKYVVPMALLLGWPKIIVGLFSAFLLGGLVGVVILIMRRKKFGAGEIMPFGPFLVMGTVIALVWGDALWSWYVQWL